jgi:dolichol-phosphate mannosyltransferase
LEKIIKLRMIGARFAEIPFHLYYNQKLSDSKMVGSITTLGYILMVLMYFWPFGGWKTMEKEFHRIN